MVCTLASLSASWRATAADPEDDQELATEPTSKALSEAEADLEIAKRALEAERATCKAATDDSVSAWTTIAVLADSRFLEAAKSVEAASLAVDAEAKALGSLIDAKAASLVTTGRCDGAASGASGAYYTYRGRSYSADCELLVQRQAGAGLVQLARDSTTYAHASRLFAEAAKVCDLSEYGVDGTKAETCEAYSEAATGYAASFPGESVYSMHSRALGPDSYFARVADGAGRVDLTELGVSAGRLRSAAQAVVPLLPTAWRELTLAMRAGETRDAGALGESELEALTEFVAEFPGRQTESALSKSRAAAEKCSGVVGARASLAGARDSVTAAKRTLSAERGGKVVITVKSVVPGVAGADRLALTCESHVEENPMWQTVRVGKAVEYLGVAGACDAEFLGQHLYIDDKVERPERYRYDFRVADHQTVELYCDATKIGRQTGIQCMIAPPKPLTVAEELALVEPDLRKLADRHGSEMQCPVGVSPKVQAEIPVEKPAGSVRDGKQEKKVVGWQLWISCLDERGVGRSRVVDYPALDYTEAQYRGAGNYSEAMFDSTGRKYFEATFKESKNSPVKVLGKVDYANDGWRTECKYAKCNKECTLFDVDGVSICQYVEAFDDMWDLMYNVSAPKGCDGELAESDCSSLIAAHPMGFH